MPPTTPPILIACCGNAMAGGDALGPAVAGLLRQWVLPGVQVADVGMNPAGLLDLLPGRSGLIIVDAVVDSDSAPGTLMDIDWLAADRPGLAAEADWSSHGLSIAAQLALAGRLEMLPGRVRLVGLAIDGRQARPGSAAIEFEQVNRVARRAARHAVRWLKQGKEVCHA